MSKDLGVMVTENRKKMKLTVEITDGNHKRLNGYDAVLGLFLLDLIHDAINKAVKGTGTEAPNVIDCIERRDI